MKHESHKQRQLQPRSGPSKERIPQQRTASTEPISKKGINSYQKLLEIEEEIVREVVRGEQHNLRKSANCNAKSVHCAEWTLICALQFADFLR